MDICYYSIEKRFISKHIVVLAQNKKQIVDRKSELITLTDEHLSIHFDSDIQITLSDNPSRYKYKLLFEENVQHQVLIKHPDYEEQFFEFVSTQAPQYDTLFVIMYPVETPLYYTKWNKRSFQPDSFSIVIIRNHYGSKEAFETLIKDLNLKRSSPNASVFYKESGEAFNQKEDSVITELRLQKSLVEIAGYNFGTRDRISILTNQFRIIWNKKPSDMSKEELSEIKAIILEYQLIEKENGLFEAPLGIGLELNTIIQKLNQVKCVWTAYPELYQPLYH